MKRATHHVTRVARRTATAAVVGLALIVTAATPVFAEEGEEAARSDDLERIEDSRVTMAYIDPETDFSVFERVMILEPYVAFRSNWRRDQNRSRSRNVRSSDMERIERDVEQPGHQFGGGAPHVRRVGRSAAELPGYPLHQEVS